MGNIGTALKRFITNKNTVTLLAIIIGTVILYLFYNYRVNKAVATQTVCYATTNIPAKTLITEDMVGLKRVLASSISKNQVRECSQVIGKYTSYASEMAENSFFYELNLKEGTDMPDSAFDNLQEGETIYNLKVTFETTYGNSIFPGDYIDLYLKTEDESGLLIYGKFIEKIKVHGVKDSNGKNVFDTTIENRIPSQLLFAVPEDLYLLLKKAEYLGLDIVIVPRNDSYSAEAGQVKVSSNYLKELIIDQTATIPDECVTQETPTAECDQQLNGDLNEDNNTNNETEE